jgi:hypothetical protein
MGNPAPFSVETGPLTRRPRLPGMAPPLIHARQPHETIAPDKNWSGAWGLDTLNIGSN